MQARASREPFACNGPYTPDFSNVTAAGFSVQSRVAYWTGSALDRHELHRGQSPAVRPDGDLHLPGQLQHHRDHGRLRPLLVGFAGFRRLTLAAAVAHSAGRRYAGIPIAPQPEVAVEDSAGNIVQNDFSSVTLQASGPGSLSSTCFGVESYGIVQFSGCNLSA